MTGVRLTATLSATQALAGMARVVSLGIDPEPLLRQMGKGLADSTQQRFNVGVGPDGAAWRPLLPAYAAIKRGSPNILVGHGGSSGLQDSITFDTGARSVVIGSSKIYAAVHQFGAIIRPKNKPALFFALMGGGGVAFGIHAKSVTIPARPYLGLSSDDEAEIAALAARFIGKRLGA